MGPPSKTSMTPNLAGSSFLSLLFLPIPDFLRRLHSEFLRDYELFKLGGVITCYLYMNLHAY